MLELGNVNRLFSKALGTWNDDVKKAMNEQLKTLKDGMDKQVKVVQDETQQQLVDETPLMMNGLKRLKSSGRISLIHRKMLGKK